MPATDAIRVKGLREMQRAFRVVGKDLSRDLRATLKEIAEPVRAEAEQRASQEITNIGSAWSQMRVGVTQKLVYVAPKERGTKGQSLASRPNLAPLLMDKAMSPALESHESEIEQRLGDALDDLARRWERV